MHVDGLEHRRARPRGQGGSRACARPAPQLFTAWGRRFHALRAAFPSERDHHGKHLVRFEQDGDSVSATFSTALEREMAERYRTPEAVMEETAMHLSLSDPPRR